MTNQTRGEYPKIEVWLLSDDETPREMSFCGGTVVAFSKTSPDRATCNEDAAAIIELSPTHGLIVVADGMGGANAGDRAAKCVVETIISFVTSTDFDGDTARSQVLDSIEAANRVVLSWGLGAGSTLVVVEYLAGETRSFHVGDATAMICSNRGRVKATTIAHAPVAMAVEAGMLDADEALVHEDRHIISNCIGSAEMKIELGPVLEMASRDTLVIGSDGLFDNLTSDKIAELVRAGQLGRQFEKLIEFTQNRMLTPDELPSKPDDLTVICFRQ